LLLRNKSKNYFFNNLFYYIIYFYLFYILLTTLLIPIMKKNFLKLICLSMLTIGAVSCSSSDDATVIIEPNPNPDPNPNPNPDPNPPAKFVHKTLIEDVTGAWCQWCPRVTHAIE